MRREEEMQGSASTCVRIRFQQHDVLPYTFCFNFLEATGSISFASPSALFFLRFRLIVCPPSRFPPLLLTPRGNSAKCTTMVFSTVDAARYISHPLLFYPSTFSPHLLFTSYAGPTTLPRPVSRFPFPPIPFIPSSRRVLSHVTPPP